MNAPIYISDLDGTLLQKNARLSEFSRASIISLLNKGISFTVATARSLTSTREILGDIPFTLPVICSNGGSIYHYRTIEPIHIEFLNRTLVAKVLLDIKRSGNTAFISVVKAGKEKVFYDGLPNEGMQWYHEDRRLANDDRLTLVDDISQCSEMNVTTITFMNRFFSIEKTKSFFTTAYGDRLRLNFFENKYSPGWHWLSVHSPLSTKANAIGKLLSATGLEGRPVTVFGDELNDIPMFNKAHRAIAVGNALPSVKEAAHEVIAGHSEDAVMKYILKENGLE